MLKTFLSTLYLLFVVIDPLGLIPVYLGVVDKYTLQEKNTIARKASLMAAGLLFCFALMGDVLLSGLSISEPAFRIAGGLLLLLTAIDMVMAHGLGFQGNLTADKNYSVAVFPLAIPLISGPGSLISVVLAMRQASTMYDVAGVLLALLTILILTYMCLKYAHTLMPFIGGRTGANIIARVFGIILAALAIQAILTAINQLMIKPLFCI